MVWSRREGVEGRGVQSPSPEGSQAGILAPGAQNTTTSIRKRGPNHLGEGKGLNLVGQRARVSSIHVSRHYSVSKLAGMPRNIVNNQRTLNHRES